MEPIGATNTRGDHRAGIQLHHRRSGLKANKEGVESTRSVAHCPSLVVAEDDENINCAKIGVILECNEDEWQSLMKEDEAGEGGGGGGKQSARSILLAVFSVTCFVFASYCYNLDVM